MKISVVRGIFCGTSALSRILETLEAFHWKCWGIALTPLPDYPWPTPCPERVEINTEQGTSLVVQWLRIRPPMQGTSVRSLVMVLRSHMPQKPSTAKTTTTTPKKKKTHSQEP